MDITLLLSAVLAAFAACFLLVRALTKGFKDWKLSEQVAVVQIFLPFAAAVFTLNALFGSSLERPSKILAAVFALLAGLLAVVKQVAATMESHPRASGAGVSFGEVVARIIRS